MTESQLPGVNGAQISEFPALNYDDRELLNALKQTVAKNTTDAEFKIFVERCKLSKLNPLQNQIWCFKSSDRLIMMAGINGFLEIANRHPAYDGFEIDCDNPTSPTWVKCKVFRKDRSRPSTSLALLKEFRKNTPTWNTSPFHMLCKVAKAIALREAFPQQLADIYTQEEMEGEAVTKVSALKALESPPVTVTVEPNLTPPKAKGSLEAAIKALEEVGVTEAEVLKYVRGNTGETESLQIASLRDAYRCLSKLSEAERPQVIREIFHPKFTAEDDISVEAIEG